MCDRADSTLSAEAARGSFPVVDGATRTGSVPSTDAATRTIPVLSADAATRTVPILSTYASTRTVPVLSVDCSRPGAPLGDLFGIFFEDLNHAADGGLYAEMVRNRSFEFDPIDRKEYHALTAWEAVDGAKLAVRTENPVHERNPHWLEVTAGGPAAGVRNLGFGPGMFFEAGKRYRFSMLARCGDAETNPAAGLPAEPNDAAGLHAEPNDAACLCQETNPAADLHAESNRSIHLHAALESGSGEVLAEACFEIAGAASSWQRFTATLTPTSSDAGGRLSVRIESPAARLSNSPPISAQRLSNQSHPDDVVVHLDMVSLFPADTFLGRENGLRRDIAQLLADLKPKFMRFPGGCLVHDGQLDPDARDSMYRWKNTIGDLDQRPARRNNWGYNQTLGFGYFEFFQFCEDIGAKPLPVLPAGYDPHHARIVPLDELQPWIDDALDLIEFANGGTDTVWGAKRASLGHPEPFGLEYLAIGNEEVGAPFFERYAVFHDMLRERHPEIRLINSAGPFPAGGEYERGWASAREKGSDLVDEHYYTSPEWLLANLHRYDGFDPDGPKVFLGEYATWGNTVWNALCEAAYMTQLEKDAHAVALACYAPLLCNVDYVNWKPDLIWFDNRHAFGTVNYHVQKLFMHHQGTHVLPTALSGFEALPVSAPAVRNAVAAGAAVPPINGTVSLGGNEVDADFTHVVLRNLETGESLSCADFHVEPGAGPKLVGKTAGWTHWDISFTACRTSGAKGYVLHFGGVDAANHLIWEIGGWQNQDSIVGAFVNGRNTALTQSLHQVETNRPVQYRLEVEGRTIRTFADDQPVNAPAEDRLPVVEPLYATASLDEETGDVIVKVVNLQDVALEAEIRLDGRAAMRPALSEHRSENKDEPGLATVQSSVACSCTLYELSGHALDLENSLDAPNRVVPTTTETAMRASGGRQLFPPHSFSVLRFR